MGSDRTRFSERATRFATALLLVCGAAPAAERLPVAITDVSIVDVEHGSLVGPRTVLIADGRIVAVGAPSKVAVPGNAERVDGRGKYLMPGLVDMHVHLFNNASHRPPNTWSFPLYIANGVTGVREMASVPEGIATVKQWRREVAEASLVAPHIVAAGVVAWGPSPGDAAHQVDLAADAGADFIKVFSEISEPAWRAVLEAAQRRALPVMGHVPAGVSALTAAEAGQRSEEHLMQVFEACSTIEQSTHDARSGLEGNALVTRRDADEAAVLAAFDARTCDRAAQALARAGETQVPTLVLDYVESKARDADPSRDPRWQYLRKDERARWQRIARELTPEERDVAAKRWPVATKIVAALHRADVPILAGTDAPMLGVYPGLLAARRARTAGRFGIHAGRSAARGDARAGSVSWHRRGKRFRRIRQARRRRSARCGSAARRPEHAPHRRGRPRWAPAAPHRAR